MTLRATARMQVVLEVEASASWGPQCTVEQVHKQASENIRAKLRNLSEANPGIRFIGTPTFSAVTIEESK